jgi:hypothetical protein
VQIRTRAFSAVIAAALLGLIAAPLLPSAGTARAADPVRPKVVVVVGPTHGLTASNLADGERMARIAESHGADVRRVFHPDATWAAVAAESQGANVLIYLGHGNGFPSPHGSTLMADRHDGMGLNPVAGGSSSTVKYYGEQYVAGEIRLAPNAVVILNHACYTAGSSEPGYPDPTPDVAVQRVDNFAAGFLAAGAGAVVALGLYDADPVLEGLWGAPQTLDQLFMAKGGIGNYEIHADSLRTPGAKLHLDPQAPTEFYRAISGRLDLLTTDVLTAAPVAPPPPPAPDTAPPRAGIVDLPDTVAEDAFAVGWKAVDGGSGVAACDVQVSADAGPWSDWLAGTTGSSALYVGRSGHGYAFRVRCTDGKGNQGDWDVSSTWAPAPKLAAGGFARVVVGPLNMRAAPSTAATKLGTLPSGSIVALTDGPASANGYAWFRVTAPIREWAPVGEAQSGVWVAASGSDIEYVVPVQAPNATTVSPAIGYLSLSPIPAPGAAAAEGSAEPAPISFTPDGDGRNDALRIGYRLRWDLASLRLNIYRAADSALLGAIDLQGLSAGDQVFDWDGRLDGGRVPDGQVVIQLVGQRGATTYRAPGGDITNPAVRAATTVTVATTPVRTAALRIAGGYRSRLSTAFSTAVGVRNGTYVTLRATIAPAEVGVAVRFYHRIGKGGAWTLLSTGRTDASGTATWSRVVKVAPAATGYGRYVYFKVSVVSAASAATPGDGWSNAVRASVR